MARWNYVSRNRTSKPRKLPLEVQKERVNKVLDFILERKEVGDFILQKEMGWGPGTHERIGRIVRTEYSDEVEWNKKPRTWKSIPLDPDKLISEQI